MNQDRFQFRVWDTHNKQIVNVRSIDFDSFGLVVEVNTETYCWSNRFEPPNLDGIILMQSTGLRDSEGKLIFEGDKISNNFGTDKEVIREVKIGQEEFKGCWVAEIISGNSKMGEIVLLGHIHLLNFKVVGNIYELQE